MRSNKQALREIASGLKKKEKKGTWPFAKKNQ